MADLLVLSWDRNRLSGLEVHSTLTGPRIQAGFSVAWPETLTANWLQETLRLHGVHARQTAVALPREDTVLRLLELPAVPDQELPTLVRFQAAARSAQPLDQLLLDFLPLPQRNGTLQKEVWLATAPQSTVDPIRKLLDEAGLELVQLTLSSCSLVELIARGEARQSIDGTGASLIVLRDRARMELAVISQRQLIATHAVKWSSVNEIPPVTKMLAEVSRVLVQVQRWLPDGTLQRAWVIGDDNDVGDLPAALAKRWNCPVERFDPWKDSAITPGSVNVAGPSSEYATVAGLALIQGGALTPKLDLLHPRQPPPKRDPRKPYYVAAAAAGLLITAVGTAIVQQSLASYDSRIADLTTQDSGLTSQLNEGKPTSVAAQALETWRSRSVNQLQQIGELYQVMDGTDKLVLSDYRFTPNVGEAMAKITAMGNAKSRNDAEQFFARLADLPKFQNGIHPKPITPSNRDSEYNNRFETDIEMTAPRKSTAATAKP